MPLFTLITPTCQRDSLLRCCESVDRQTLHDWQHVVMVDCGVLVGSLLSQIAHPNRLIIRCNQPHRNYGNTCRSHAWKHATGDWLLGLDDDNYLASDHVLADLAAVLNCGPVEEQWCLFPILRHGFYFLNDPPGLCLTDTANVVARRAVARWPDIPDYEADGLWVEELKQQYPYRAFPEVEPIVIMEKSNHGQ